MKRFLIASLKIGLSAALIVWLVVRAAGDGAFAELRQQYLTTGFRWDLLAAAAGLTALAALLTFIRWYVLVRALDIPFTLNQSLRLGLLGYLFNLAPMGIVGGDLLKAVLLGRARPGRRMDALASVAVDRAIGLYVLFLVATVAIVLTGYASHADATVRWISLVALAITLVATLAILSMTVPGLFGAWLMMRLARGRFLGPPLARLIAAVRLYRHNPGALVVSVLLTVGVHVLFTAGIYLITVAIYQSAADGVAFGGEFVVALLSAATGVIPLTIGPMEAVLDVLYVRVFSLQPGMGFVVALAYRLVTLAIAAIGMCYYLAARRELAEAVRSSQAADA